MFIKPIILIQDGNARSFNGRNVAEGVPHNLKVVIHLSAAAHIKNELIPLDGIVVDGLVARVSRFTYVMELKLHNNGGKEAAVCQIIDRQYLEPFKAPDRQVIGLAIELQDEGKGLLDWQQL